MKLNPCTAIVDVDGTVCGEAPEIKDFSCYVYIDCPAYCGSWDGETLDDAITLWNLNNKLASEEEA